MTLSAHENPDHDELSRLARDDPEAFEALRKQLISQLIERAPRHLQRRLEGVQFRVDAVRARSRNALGATVKVYQLMWGSFLGLREELITLREPLRAPQCKAQVLDFRPRRVQASAA